MTWVTPSPFCDMEPIPLASTASTLICLGTEKMNTEAVKNRDIDSGEPTACRDPEFKRPRGFNSHPNPTERAMEYTALSG